MFGHLKRDIGFDRFMLRGAAGAAAEVYLVATARLLCASLVRRIIIRSAFRSRLIKLSEMLSKKAILDRCEQVPELS